MSDTEHKRISVAICANSLGINGISTMIMNYCCNIDLANYNITILVGAPIADFHKNRCERLGIHVVELPERKKSSRAYYLELNKVLRHNDYDIFHIHGNSATMTVELLLAKLNGIKVRIAHSHNTTCTNMNAHRLLLPMFHHVYTHRFACGEDAGKWLFGDRKFYVIPNGFCVEDFKFDASSRQRIRKELQLQGKFVIGHIGRFNEQKNQIFLINIFEKIARLKQDSYLLLVGTGPDFEKIKSIIEKHPYKERIIVYGESKEVAAMYATMDVFVLPSRYEGLPIVLLEAQINGLPCVVSDNVTTEVDIDNHIIRLSLDDSINSWVEAILRDSFINRMTFHKENTKKINNYDIKNNSVYLESLYKAFVNRRKL